ncbi:SAM-dependent methyltransferase [Actinotalea fermentans]|uniref:Cyclopropane-fatty-acyl-phospholipid synthase n=1 Tax=Actinotalea fermentans TaxID=43671 RepID=A0A511YVW8_9CELL|nr:cyclopropane-fatty-acyl-phospholipid synthase family protein [Actinotalea fermentans]KGM15584.1 cyclopropane-fatty-acyl-phospholipid synthase [Actinotalea fermentans ATCC 43279 = JCM 9966 = DSM 3133]GEN79355.1 cyclopropane-fatty-acyl-phospholipid synthase [Actinotalea fermentans]
MSTVPTPSCLAGPGARPDARPCVRARLARVLAGRVVRRVPVRVESPGGAVLGWPDRAAAPDGVPVLQIVRPRAFFARLGHAPKIGFGEAYMAGDWRPAPGVDLGVALRPFAASITHAVPAWMQRLRGLVEERLPAHQRNTLHGARRNIQAHYDLSNDLFAAFLDPSLTYSSALFDDDRPLAGQGLEEAQLRKVDAALDAAGVGPGTRLLEIGTGWGTLALRAAERGAHVTTLTLSDEQARLARERVAAAGLTERVDVRLQDYREAAGTFDAVVSIEMIEAVGEEYWPTYFAAIDRLLAPGGTAVVQSILMAHDRYLATRRSFSWIQKYIFPGGIIPSTRAIEQATVAHTSLRVVGSRHFGASYAETLRRWRAQFDAAWPQVRELGFDETFRRMWEFYLAYSESGFATGYLDVAQLRLRRVTG